MKVEDEFETTWRVESGDPANVHILSLNRAHVGWIVLPRKVLITGDVDASFSLADGIEPLRAIRLADCMEYLQANRPRIVSRVSAPSIQEEYDVYESEPTRHYGPEPARH